MSTPAIQLAVIGGSGLYALPLFEQEQALEPDTPYGAPSGPIRIGQLYGQRVAFLARHGEAHALPPHRVNYRANLHALAQLQPAAVLAINTVGGITPACAPRALVVPDQIIDYTWGRASSFWDEAGPMRHAEFGEPYSARLRNRLLDAGQRAGVALVDGGCYGATQGPRFETRAEIARMRQDGCDLVGMTGMPEAALARELELDYTCLAPVANWAAGCGDGEEISLDEVFANLAATNALLPRLLEALLA
ncbi:S-methyl-5'-thioinosine phosphorylase [Denitratimonas sp. CY0512]|uniref:S-methyl-5'-thioinosine phosphorylase n=1 Tax=Denitratimonas sp. CY0512 TaxID=3131940 RepID=UPI0030A78082